MSIKDLTPWNWCSKRDIPTRRSDYSLWNDFDREFDLIFEDFFRDFYNTRRGFPEMLKRDMLENAKFLWLSTDVTEPHYCGLSISFKFI